MATYTGNIRKMRSALTDPVSYSLPFGEENADMNVLIGSELSLEYLGEIHCIGCGRKTSKSFAQGYCYPCLLNSPETDKCILHPELCEAHKGISRDMKWSEKHCLQEHIVYLSDTTGLKVGVTRFSQVPTRWIDQGATRAVRIARAPDRYTAGTIEVFLKDHFRDKTNWRNMLMNRQAEKPDLAQEKRRASAILEERFGRYLVDDNEVTSVNFPVREYPLKIVSLTFDKTPEIRGTLTGIKGQYLLLDGGRVLNIRKHNGYKVRMVTA
ncbi:MAG: DUF2797 domain-containing protein [Marinilabiliales bacterium]|nr:MAG: DUF2797 domain-containing protein [Marinilabiliales bacterium]